jgi:hypothetical protein
MHDSKFCFLHDPATVDDADGARRKGGRHRRRPKVQATEPFRLTSVDDLVPLLETAITDTLLLENSIARSRALAHLAQVARSVLQGAELEARIAAIEDLVNPRRELIDRRTRHGRELWARLNKE